MSERDDAQAPEKREAPGTPPGAGDASARSRPQSASAAAPESSALGRWLDEIHRRSLWQVLALYVGAGWAILQVIDPLVQHFVLPDWVFRGAIVLLLIGLPIVLTTAALQHGLRSRRAAAPASGVRRWFRWRNALVGGVAAFTLLGVGTAVFAAMRTLGIGPAGTLLAKGALEARAQLLLAEVAADDESMARVATEALRIDLAGSPSVRLVPQAAIADALERMGRARDAPLDFALARELAQREGIPAVLGVEIQGAAGGWLLTAQLAAAATGEVLVSGRQVAEDSTRLLDAIDALSKHLRERIGEPLASLRADPPLARVTTPDLEALRLYSQALRAIEREAATDRGLALLEEAIARDTMFAMAYRKLGTELSNRNLRRGDAARAIRRAFEYRDRLPPAERYLTEGTYHSTYVNEPERAIAAYRNLLARDSLNTTALINMGVIYSYLRDHERSLQYSTASLRVDSTSALALFNTGANLLAMGRVDSAKSLLATAEARFPDNPLFMFARQFVAAYERDHYAFQRAADAFARAQRGSAVWSGIALSAQADIAAARGRYAEAVRLLDEVRASLDPSRDAHAHLRVDAEIALLATLVLRDPAQGRAQLDAALARVPLAGLDVEERPYLDLASAYAWSGAADRARALLAEFERLVEPRFRASARDGGASIDRTHGAIALAESRWSDAIAAFRRGDTGQCEICSLPGLAAAFDRAGQPDSAIAAYEAFFARNTMRMGVSGYFAVPWGDRYFLASALERLAELYDARGDTAQASAYYARFVELWAGADPALRPRVEAAQRRLREIAAARG